MSTSEIILEILKYTVPAGLVLTAVMMVMKEQQKKAETQERYQVVQQTYKEVMPLRLQAYERAILFLERISLDNLVLRVDGRQKTVRQFQSELLTEIRAEYDHNVAQQLYISESGWDSLVRAKDRTVTMINQAARELSPEVAGTELGKKVLNKMVEMESAPAGDAIRLLKRDIHRMFSF